MVYGLTSSTTVLLKRDRHVTGDSDQREKWMRVLHEPIKVVVIPLQECKLEEFVIGTGELARWKCVCQLVSYHCDIYEGKTM